MVALFPQARQISMRDCGHKVLSVQALKRETVPNKQHRSLRYSAHFYTFCKSALNALGLKSLYVVLVLGGLGPGAQAQKWQHQAQQAAFLAPTEQPSSSRRALLAARGPDEICRP